MGFVCRARMWVFAALCLLLSVVAPQSGALAQTITSVSPSSAPSGAVVTVNGTNLNAMAGGTVDFYDSNFVLRGTTSVTSATSTSLTFTVPGSLPINQVMHLDIYDSFMITGASINSAFTRTASVAAPTVTSISPTAGPTGGGTTVTITGTNFTGATAVTFGATAAASYTVNSATQITATAPAGSVGTVDVRVTTSGGTSATSAADQYTYVAAPTVTSISPTSGPTGGGTTVTISGTNFSGATAVTFGGTAATGFTVNSATQITATAPAKSAGTVDVRVTTSGGTSATSAADQYTYVAAPTVTSISPTAGSTGGGTTVTITGTNFSGATAVTFGATAATGFTVNSATQMTATAPAGSVGTVDVRVTTSGGTSATSAADQYTYVAAPTVTSISPTTGPTSGGTSVTLTGTGFAGATAVSFGGTAATGFTVNSATQITATAPANSAGTVNVRVTTAGGTSATGAANQFTYGNAPTLSSFTFGSVIGYNAGAGIGTSIDVSLGGSATGSPSGYSVSSSSGGTFGASAATANGGTVSITSGGVATYTPALGFRGNDAFYAKASNGFGTSSAATITISVGNPTLVFALSGSGTRGIVLSGTGITVSGGAAPYSCATTLASGALPSGVSLNADCTLTGTPAASGSFAFTVLATDSSTGTGPYSQTSTTLTLAVAAPTVSIAPATGALPAASVGTAYSQTFTASGGTAPTSFAITAGAVPAGLSLSSAGSLSGTPTQAGTFNFNVTATDSSTGGSGGPYTATSAYSLTVAAPTIVLAPSSLPAPTYGVNYVQSLSASGGTGPYSYAVTSGQLPAGVTLASDGTLSGTTTSSGSYNFTITATDSSTGSGPFTASRAYTFTIGAPPAAPVPLTPANGAIINTALPNISGTAAPSVTVSVIVDGSNYGSTTASAGGSWSFSMTVPLADGSHTVTAFATENGLQSSNAATNSYTIDTQAPASPAITVPANGATVYQSPIVSGSAEANAMVSVRVDGSAAGTTMTDGSGNFSFATSGLASGAHSVTATATDAAGNASAASPASTFSIDTAPVANAVSLSVGYASSNTAVPLNVTGGTATSVALGTAPAHGTATVNGRSITYTPAAGYYGADGFTYSATNGAGTSAPAVVSVTVANPAAPLASDRSGVSIPFNGTGAAVDLSTSITGIHSSIAIGAAPAHGTTSVAGDVVTYTPAPGYYGADSFTYTATGPGGTSAPATVSLTVGTPAAPTAADRSGVAVAYNSPGTAVDLSTSITGIHSSIAIGTAPAHGTTSVAGDVVTYTPAPGYYGADSFAYTATGPGGTSAPATVSLTVGMPAAPTAADRSGVAVAYGSAGTAVDLSTSITGIHSSIAIGSAPAHGTTSVAGDVVTYTPTAGYYGADSFTYTATGPGGTSAPATVSVTVATPAAPVVSGSSEPLRVSVSASSGSVDVDLSDLVTGVYSSIEIAQPPQHGTVQIRQGGNGQSGQRQQSVASLAITYQPDIGYAGQDSFAWVAVGPGGTSAQSAVSVTVVGVLPTAVAKSATTGDGQTVSIDLTQGAGEGPFTAATIVSVSPANAAEATIVASGTEGNRQYRLDVTPAAKFDGVILVRYTLTNQYGTSEPATVTIAVDARPDPTADPNIAALNDAQAEAARRFARTQTGNFMRRNEQLHGGGGGRFNMGLNLSSKDVGYGNAPAPADKDNLALVDRASSDAGRMSSRLAGSHAPDAADAKAGMIDPSGAGDDGARRVGQIALWTSGTIEVGTIDRTTDREKVSLSTGGLSGGIDMKLSPRLVVGLGGGFGNEVSKIGGGAARVRVTNSLAAVYGSYSAAQGGFLDFVLGYGGLDYQLRRNVVETGAVALGSRNGDMLVASLSAGLERGAGAFRWSLYGRGEYLGATLDAYAETGAGRYDLRFARRAITSASGVFGGRAQLTQRTTLGPITPHVRFELTHEFADADPQWLDYADISGAPAYSLATSRWKRDHMDVSFGTALDMGNRWGLDLELGVTAGQDQTNGRLKVQLSRDF